MNGSIRASSSVSIPFKKLLLGFLLTAVAQLGCTASASNLGLTQQLDNANYDAAVVSAQNLPLHPLHKLIASARAHKLYQDPTWLVLLHYKSNFLGNSVSQVDDGHFFLSRRGKRDPQAELEATLASFFSQHPVEPTQLSPQCRFVARFHWLNDQLNFDSAGLKTDPCPSFQRYRTGINADSITLVFASTHPNSPSSMFGHTLLRFNKKGQTEATRMLAFTIHYAAQVDVDNDLLYAYSGISGGFEGRFRILPYYMKLREYSEMENRSLWEYTLKLSQKQIDFILMHAYELVPSYFDYYFFGENCAYHLLSLLEVSMPEKGLTDAFHGWTIPVDTIRLLADKGLIGRVDYHPGQNTLIVERQKGLSDAENTLALQLLRVEHPEKDERLTSLPVSRQAPVLDLVYDYLRYNRVKESDALEPTISPKERGVLVARSKLGITTSTPSVETPATRPDLGHRTGRLGIGLGAYEDRGFLEFSWRGAYHDLLDPSPGYQPNSQLEFFNARVRLLNDPSKLELYQLNLVDIISLEPRDKFFKNISWKAGVGIDSVAEPNGNLRQYFSLNAGAGLTYKLHEAPSIHVYGLMNGQTDYGKVFNEDYRILAGPSLGMLSQITDRLKLHIQADLLVGLAGDKHNDAFLEFSSSYTLTKRLSLRFGFRRTLALDNLANEFFAQLHVYH